MMAGPAAELQALRTQRGIVTARWHILVIVLHCLRAIAQVRIGALVAEAYGFQQYRKTACPKS